MFYNDYGLFLSLFYAITVIVAQVPECLPSTLSLAKTKTLSKLYKKNCLVKRAGLVENLGSISTICCNKTGTLTKNSMRVKYLW